MIKKRFISILALLCLTVSGAWAQEVTLLTTILSTGDNASFKSGSKTFDNKVTVTISGSVYNFDDYWGWNSESGGTLTVTAAPGYTITRVKFYSNNGATEGSAFDEEAPFEANLVYTDQKGPHAKVNGTSIGKYGVTKIEVYGYANPVTGVTLSPTTATLTVGETETLTAIVAPENAKDKSVTWTTSNASVATVANGVVTAVGAGTATITVTTTDGAFTATCTVTVTAPVGPEVTWDAATKQATFTMPAYDVELQVEYYPGMFTFGGDAIEGGTVEVVGLTGDALPAGFEKDAEGNIYVAKGTTFTVKATPEEGYHFVCWSDDQTNTNPEREISMPADGSDLSLSATFAENEYDITFSEGTNPDPENPEWTATPNPAKTKQTVTVTYSGSKKVIGVKAEKKAPAPPTLKDALADGATVVITYTWFDTNVTTFTYTNNGGTYTGNTTGADAGNFNNGMSKDGTTLKFQASSTGYTGIDVSIDFYTDTNEYVISKQSHFTSFTISVNGTDLTSQLKEVK